MTFARPIMISRQQLRRARSSVAAMRAIATPLRLPAPNRKCIYAPLFAVILLRRRRACMSRQRRVARLSGAMRCRHYAAAAMRAPAMPTPMSMAPCEKRIQRTRRQPDARAVCRARRAMMLPMPRDAAQSAAACRQKEPCRLRHERASQCRGSRARFTRRC